MRIQHNIMAMNAYRNYSNNTSALSKNLEKLSSGYKINRAGDDAAGLAISEKMRAQITGLEGAQQNAKDGISLVQTAEGALTEVHDMLNRMYSLAEQSANGTYDGTDREQLNKEVSELKNEINRIANTSNFNGIKLLDGSMGGGAKIDDALLGTSKVSFSLGVTSKNIVAGQTASIEFAKATGTDGISVSFSDTDGKVTIKLGTKSGATYTAEQITEAVRNAAKTYGDGATTNADAIAKAYSGFTMTADGPITATAGSTSLVMADTEFANGTGEGGLKLQIGPDGSADNMLAVTIKDCHTTSMGTDGGKSINDIDISTQDGAQEALKVIEDAINYVSDVRGTLGATQNRLDHTINNLSVMQENIQDAESTIRDTDVADEMMAYTKNNILVQSAQAMLAQANAVPQGVLQLLQ